MESTRRLREIQRQLATTGYAVPGSIMRSTQRRDTWLWHVQLWDPAARRRRTHTYVLPHALIQTFRAAIAADRRLRALHRELRALSMRALERERRAHLRRPPRTRDHEHRT